LTRSPLYWQKPHITLREGVWHLFVLQQVPSQFQLWNAQDLHLRSSRFIHSPLSTYRFVKNVLIMSASDDGVWWESSWGPSWGGASWASFLTVSCFFSLLNPPQGHELLEFAREVVATYLEDEDAVTRREAAVCCCHLVEHSSCVMQSATTTPHLVNTRSGRTTGVGSRRRRVLIEEVGLAPLFSLSLFLPFFSFFFGGCQGDECKCFVFFSL
jgi:hypothetical protein